jgi:two-component system chemotaxis response regulator CheB
MIRCLVADDSRVFRAILRAILTRGSEVEIVGEAADGHEVVEKVLALRPDVVTMDVRMPGQDGLDAIAEIMRRAPTPIVVVSAAAGPDRQDLSFRALQLGAVEVLGKPRTEGQGRFERDAEAIRRAVEAVAKLRLRPRPFLAAVPAAAGPPVAAARARGVARALGIVASTGGPAALARILSALPRDYPLAVLVVQHIAAGFEGGFVRWLGGESALPVELAVAGTPLRPGRVVVAAPNAHLGVASGRVALSDDPPVRGFRPSGTRLLESLALAFGAAAAGLVLSGMGEDGADGLLRIREAGGATLAQGPGTSVVFGMPRVAFERGAAAAVLELDELPAALVRLARPAGAEASP